MEIMEARFGDDGGVEAVKNGPSSPGKLNNNHHHLGDDDSGSATATGCFDCNICLDFAVEPVVTLCGHLYCWPCIYKWLHQQQLQEHIMDTTTTTRRQQQQKCPVCKAALSHASLVPLYGRGGHHHHPTTTTTKDGPHRHDLVHIPSRPSVTLTAHQQQQQLQLQLQQQHHHFHQQQQQQYNGEDYMSSTPSPTVAAATMLGGSAIAVLPWVFGDQLMGLYYPSNPYHHLLGGRGGGGGDSGGSPRLRRQEMQASRSLNRISFFLFCCVVLCLVFF